MILLLAASYACGGGSENPVVLAAGPPETAAACVARAFTARLNDEHPEFHARVLGTNGGVDSLMALREGRAHLAIATADTLAQAVNAEGPFDGKTASARTIAALYDSRAYLIASPGSALNGLSQLRDLTVGTGPRGSGMELTVRRILSAARLESRVRIEALDWGELLERFRDRRLPAFFWVDGVPSPAIDQAAADAKPLRALNTQSVVPLLQQRHGEVLYTSSGLTLGPSFDSASAGLAAVSTVLVGRDDLPETTAFAWTSALFRLAPSIARSCPAVSGLEPKTAARPEPAALHAGAALFYRHGR